MQNRTGNPLKTTQIIRWSFKKKYFLPRQWICNSILSDAFVESTIQFFKSLSLSFILHRQVAAIFISWNESLLKCFPLLRGCTQYTRATLYCSAFVVYYPWHPSMALIKNSRLVIFFMPRSSIYTYGLLIWIFSAVCSDEKGEVVLITRVFRTD